MRTMSIQLMLTTCDTSLSDRDYSQRYAIPASDTTTAARYLLHSYRALLLLRSLLYLFFFISK